MRVALTLDLHASPAGLPLSKKISEAIIREIRRGRFRPGAAVPSSRALSESLDVHRNTVLCAFEELMEQGYLKTEPGRGTYVSEELPVPHAKQAATLSSAAPSRTPSDSRLRAAKELAPPNIKVRFATSPRKSSYFPIEKGMIALLGGLPDLREAPLPALARAYRAALKNAPECLDYQSHYGQPELLLQLSQHLARERGVTAGPGEMLITRGSQQAIHLAARALARKNTVIAVERCGYPPAWEALKMAGAELSPVRVDKSGLVTDELARLCEQREVSAVYVTPHHQYPTTVTMSAARRMALLKLARKHRFVVIEDDYDHEFHFSQHPVLPLSSADHTGLVLHIGTLSKVFAPGLRLGYAVGQPALIEHMAESRMYLDRQGDHATELALSYLISDGEFGAHIRRMHRKYESRRAAFFAALSTHLGDSLSYRQAPGGLAVWARVEGGISATLWANRARERGVLVQDARHFFVDGRPRPYFRLGFPRHTEAELEEGVKRLKAARPLRGK